MALFTYGSGRLAAALFVLTILVAGFLRVRRRPIRGWPRLHNWLGGATATLGIVHGLGSVTRAQLPLGAALGLWVASAAMFLLVCEAGIGLLLTTPSTPRRLRRHHLVLMLVVLLAVAVHVVLNGPFPP